MANFLQCIQAHIQTPGDLLLVALSCLLAACSVAVLVLVAVHAFKKLLSDPLTELVLNSWRIFVQEIKGERDKAGLINGFAVVGLCLLLLVALCFEASPCILMQFTGKGAGQRGFPVLTVALLVALILVFFGSIAMIVSYTEEQALKKRSFDLSNRPPILFK